MAVDPPGFRAPTGLHGVCGPQGDPALVLVTWPRGHRSTSQVPPLALDCRLRLRSPVLLGVRGGRFHSLWEQRPPRLLGSWAPGLRSLWARTQRRCFWPGCHGPGDWRPQAALVSSAGLSLPVQRGRPNASGAAEHYWGLVAKDWTVIPTPGRLAFPCPEGPSPCPPPVCGRCGPGGHPTGDTLTESPFLPRRPSPGAASSHSPLPSPLPLLVTFSPLGLPRMSGNWGRGAQEMPPSL